MTLPISINRVVEKGFFYRRITVPKLGLYRYVVVVVEQKGCITKGQLGKLGLYRRKVVQICGMLAMEWIL